MEIAVAFIAVLILIIIAMSAKLFKNSIVRSKSQPTSYTPIKDNNTVRSKYADIIESGSLWFLSKDPENIEISSFDGTKLHAYFLPYENSKKNVILMHGYRSIGMYDFAGIFKFYHNLGFNILLPDQRAHGLSEGKYICFGALEKYDCLEWIKYINKRDGEDNAIFLCGISMGASTVLMTAGLELSRNVKGIVADCGFTSAWDIFSYLFKTKYHILVFPFLYCMNVISVLFAKFDFKASSTIDALKNCDIPILFFHGKKDLFVPEYMSEINNECCKSDHKLVVIEDAAHAVSYIHDKERYENELLEFFNKYSC